MELMTAEEARSYTSSYKEKISWFAIKWLLLWVRIKAKRGEFKLTSRFIGDLNEEEKRVLEELGYEVDSGTDYDGSGWVGLRW